MYIGYFQDINKVNYTVKIIPRGTASTTTEIMLSGQPVIISQKSDGLFSEIKSLGCTIEILTSELYKDLYASGIQDVEVFVLKGSTVLFEGYLTPYIYDQAYSSVVNTVQLEAVSKLSTLQDLDYMTVTTSPQIVSFKDLIWHLLINGAKYDVATKKVCYCTGLKERLSSFKISEANFFDNDDAKTPWKMNEVLEHICKYLSVSCVEYENVLYLVDYQYVARNTTSDLYYFDNANIEDKTTTSNFGTLVNKINKDLHFGTDANVSYDEIYNKVSVNVNTYNIENLSPKIEELQYSSNISGYPEGTTWSYTTYKSNGKVKDTYVTWNTYHTMRLLNADSNWKHRYFRIALNYSSTAPIKCTELKNTGSEPYYDPDSTTKYNKNNWPCINTRCAFIQRFSKYAEDSPTPADLSWDTYIAFNCLDDSVTLSGTGELNVNNWTDCLECPVLEYTSSEPLRYSPNAGTSWITFKGDLWYQRNTYQNDTRYKVINETDKFIMQAPVDGIMGVDAYFFAHYSEWEKYTYVDKSKKVLKWWPTRSKNDPDYGKGYPMLKCKLQIGDKFWNGTSWGPKPEPTWNGTSWVGGDEPTFYINYNNSPSNGSDEGFACFQWQKVAPNYSYTSKLSGDCWGIPIKKSDNVSGILKFTMYTPSQFGPLFKGTDYTTPWYLLSPVVFMKDFELNYVYTDNSAWYLKEEKDNNDIVYTNEVETSFSKELDSDIEMKINTYSDNVPISRSFVMYGDNNEFMTKFRNYTCQDGSTTKRQPEYIHIEKLLDHYMNKKLIYNASIKNNALQLYPFAKYNIDFDSVDTFKNDDGSIKSFILDSYEQDLKNGSVKINLIEW